MRPVVTVRVLPGAPPLSPSAATVTSPGTPGPGLCGDCTSRLTLHRQINFAATFSFGDPPLGKLRQLSASTRATNPSSRPGQTQVAATARRPPPRCAHTVSVGRGGAEVARPRRPGPGPRARYCRCSTRGGRHGAGLGRPGSGVRDQGSSTQSDSVPFFSALFNWNIGDGSIMEIPPTSAAPSPDPPATSGAGDHSA